MQRTEETPLRSGSIPYPGNLSLLLEVENLLDEKYDIYVDLPSGAAGLYRMPGRSFNLGVNLHR